MPLHVVATVAIVVAIVAVLVAVVAAAIAVAAVVVVVVAIVAIILAVAVSTTVTFFHIVLTNVLFATHVATRKYGCFVMLSSLQSSTFKMS